MFVAFAVSRFFTSVKRDRRAGAESIWTNWLVWPLRQKSNSLPLRNSTTAFGDELLVLRGGFDKRVFLRICVLQNEVKLINGVKSFSETGAEIRCSEVMPMTGFAAVLELARSRSAVGTSDWKRHVVERRQEPPERIGIGDEVGEGFGPSSCGQGVRGSLCCLRGEDEGSRCDE